MEGPNGLAKAPFPGPWVVQLGRGEGAQVEGGGVRPSSQAWEEFSLEVCPVEEEAWLPTLAETGSSSPLVRCVQEFALSKEAFLPRNNGNTAEGPFCYIC